MASSLREQIETALNVDVEGLAHFACERRAQELFDLADSLQVAGLRHLAKLDRDSVPRALGYTSTQRYVAHTRQTTAFEGRRITQTARLIAKHPLSAKALTESHISLAHADLLAAAAAKFPDPYTQNEAELVATASTQDLDTFTDTIARWRHTADLEAAATNTQHRHQTRGVWLQGRLDGSGTGRFDLDAKAFATVSAAFECQTSKPDPAHALVDRSLPQRRADALEEMAVFYGPDSPDNPDIAEPNPTGRSNGAIIEAVINLNFDSNQPPLTELLSDIHQTGPVPHPIIEQICCDAHWRRVMRGTSQILDYSSPTADITPNQRRAARLRDHHCQFHGCNRPWQWCDLHHLTSRLNGGPTTLDNLTLVCRFHHSLIHQEGWQLTRNPTTGQIHTRSP